MVEHLEICGPFDCTVFDWGSLNAFTRNKVLLPNLQHLVCNLGTAGWISGLTAFLSPSLVKIGTTPFSCETQLNIEDASMFFANISMYCPLLEEFSILPFTLSAWGQLDGFITVPGLPFFRYFGCMYSLQVFTTNLTIFESIALPTLGRLPHLEKLIIKRDEGAVTYLIPAIVLPDDSFPMLRVLKLPFLEMSEFRSVWNIQKLVTRPKKMKVGVFEFQLEDDAEALLNDICQLSPQIFRLTVAFDLRIKFISPNAFWSLQLLSLQKLSIEGLYSFPLDTACRTLSTACPSLRGLGLPDVRVTLSDLRYFAQFPRLEYLHIYVNWKSCQELNRSLPAPSSVSEYSQ